MKFIHTLKRIASEKGFLLTLGISLLLLFFFYGKLLRHPASTYFSAGGDGLQIYYETIYHVKYDHAYWSQSSINYPYGESIFFTGAMPFVNNVAKIFGTGAAPLGVALINLLMLFSPVLGALFLYAIFRHLRLPWYYGALSATAIAFLSPQVMRMAGHYSLTWIFLIPAFIYMLLRFYDQAGAMKSVFIGFIVFLGASTHLYFLAFFATIGGAYWLVLFLSRDRGFGRIKFAAKHLAIQFIAPVLLLQSLIMMSDHVHDRTHAPWGYLVFHSRLDGVFYPYGKPYEPIFHSIFKNVNPPDDQLTFEGMSYVGLVAMGGLLLLFSVQLYRLFRKRFRLVLQVTDNKALNIFFWVSLVLLYFSFGKPFIGGHENWLTYLGPVRQFRAIGRFTWAFFYIANIIAVYRIFRVLQHKKILRILVLVLVPSLLFYDAYYLNAGKEKEYDNHIAELEDESDKLPADQWMKGFNAAQFQAILPLPYFHQGSENIARVPADADIVRQSYIVSLKTGLPLMGVNSARVSLSQTVNLISLVMDPNKPFDVMKDIHDKRPLLLLVKKEMLDENEKRILALAKQIATSAQYEIYSLALNDLANIPETYHDWLGGEVDAMKKYSQGKFFSSDSTPFFIYRNYDNGNGRAFRGKASHKFVTTEFERVIDTVIPVPGTYLCSFWMDHIRDDIYPRVTMETFVYDTSKKVQPFYSISDALRNVQAIDGNWGLIEFPITVPAAGMHLQFTVWNKDLKPGTELCIDELLLRPGGTNLFFRDGNDIFWNNCYYHGAK
ncbi:MAG: hypothetical protein HY064_10695 [Bacteroidetes bacterium]|nr:hypothetical protein [Bacteroidota bacterium]